MKVNGHTIRPLESTIQLIPTDNLFLDAKNPRLQGTDGHADQRTLLKQLWTECSLDELMLSIAKNGYFPEEPFFAIKEESKHIVVEGNRRLAAVKILRDPKLQQELRATDIPLLRRILEKKPPYQSGAAGRMRISHLGNSG